MSLEEQITRTIDRHYRKHPKVRVSHIRTALKNVDRLLLRMLAKVAPKKWRSH
jgi:hypothetical protein